MKYITVFLIAGIFFFTGQSTFAADPIAEFCAGPVAKSDPQAVQQCNEYAQSLAASSVKKNEKDVAQAAIDAINAEIKIAEQKIRLQNTIISKLTRDIGAKEKVVESLEDQIQRQSQSIADIVKKLNVHDSVSIPAVFLGSKTLSTFYTEVDTLYTLNKQLVSLVGEVKNSKEETEAEKKDLEDRKDKETDAREAIASEKKLIDRKKAEKAAILALKTSEYNVA